MKRDFFYKINVELSEPSEGKDGQAVLSQFEATVKKILIEKNKTVLVVKDISASESYESAEETGLNQRLLEETQDESFLVSGLTIHPQKSDPLFAPEINYQAIVREKIEAVLKRAKK